MPRIAVAEELDHIADMLRNNGYTVVQLGNEQKDIDAIVISGIDKNMMGMQDTESGIPVINAEGQTAEQVFHQINRSVPH